MTSDFTLVKDHGIVSAHNLRLLQGSKPKAYSCSPFALAEQELFIYVNRNFMDI